MALAVAACAAAACAAAACATGGKASSDPGGSVGDSGAAGAPDEWPSSISVRAVSLTDNRTTIDAEHLAPLQTVKLEATVKPAVVHALRFSLLDDALDAVLSETDVLTSSADGIGETILTAPSGPTRFRVRVTTSGAAPHFFQVEVPSTGVAHVQVNVGYAGLRRVSEYTATAWENTTCAALSGAPPDDGPVSVTSETWPVTLDVAAGVPLAVILRVGKYIWGCTSIDSATEGGVTEVEVAPMNVPIKLDVSRIRFKLGLDDLAPLRDGLAPVRDAILTELVGDAEDDVDALLDAMRGTLDDADASAFSSTRRAETWESVLRAALPNAGEALRGPLRTWIDGGVEGLPLKEALVGELKGTGVEGEAPSFTLDSAFGLSPSLSTFATTGTPSWSAQADDTVLIGLDTTFDPAGFLLGAATAPARDAASDATDVASALATTLPCKAFAKTLVAHGDSSKTSYEGCDEACTESLCREGVRELYRRATARASDTATLALGLSGAGGVGYNANLTELTGSWIGKLALPDDASGSNDAPEPIHLSGLASAVDPSATGTPAR